MSTATDLDTVRERNLRLWTQHTASFEAGDLDACAALWHEDGRIAVAYPIPGMPAELVGRDAIIGLFATELEAADTLEQRDVHFHQTTDPEVAFVQFSWHARLKDGSTYDNAYVTRVTIRDGRFHEVYEYYGERAHADLIGRLAAAAA
jgi:ketosteroid isomerase-like protein